MAAATGRLTMAEPRFKMPLAVRLRRAELKNARYRNSPTFRLDAMNRARRRIGVAPLTIEQLPPFTRGSDPQ